MDLSIKHRGWPIIYIPGESEFGHEAAKAAVATLIPFGGEGIDMAIARLFPEGQGILPGYGVDEIICSVTEREFSPVTEEGVTIRIHSRGWLNEEGTGIGEKPHHDPGQKTDKAVARKFFIFYAIFKPHKLCRERRH